MALSHINKEIKFKPGSIQVPAELHVLLLAKQQLQACEFSTSVSTLFPMGQIPVDTFKNKDNYTHHMLLFFPVGLGAVP